MNWRAYPALFLQARIGSDRMGKNKFSFIMSNTQIFHTFTVFSYVTLRNMMENSASVFYHEKLGSTFLRNLIEFLPSCTA
jgi:hypothetical protein